MLATEPAFEVHVPSALSAHGERYFKAVVLPGSMGFLIVTINDSGGGLTRFHREIYPATLEGVTMMSRHEGAIHTVRYMGPCQWGGPFEGFPVPVLGIDYALDPYNSFSPSLLLDHGDDEWIVCSGDTVASDLQDRVSLLRFDDRERVRMERERGKDGGTQVIECVSTVAA